MQFCIRLPNFVQIEPPATEQWRHILFQDNCRGGSILLLVSHLMMSLFSEGQRLSANQISSTYLNSRLRYNYFRFGKTTVCYIELLLPISILTISPYSACHYALGWRISSKSVHPQRGYDVKLIFKMAAAAAQFLVTFLSFRMSVSMFICVYQQTKFRSYSSIHSWNITIYGFEKQTSVILELYFQFLFRP